MGMCWGGVFLVEFGEVFRMGRALEMLGRGWGGVGKDGFRGRVRVLTYHYFAIRARAFERSTKPLVRFICHLTSFSVQSMT